MDEREDAPDVVDDDEDEDGDLRRRTFLERHDWIPWIAAAALVGGVLGVVQGGWRV